LGIQHWEVLHLNQIIRNLIQQCVSFAITNPPLMNIVWDILLNTWDPIIEKIFLTNPDADFQGMADHSELSPAAAKIAMLF